MRREQPEEQFYLQPLFRERQDLLTKEEVIDKFKKKDEGSIFPVPLSFLDYIDALGRSNTMDVPTVSFSNGGLWVADGNHRICEIKKHITEKGKSIDGVEVFIRKIKDEKN